MKLKHIINTANKMKDEKLPYKVTYKGEYKGEPMYFSVIISANNESHAKKIATLKLGIKNILEAKQISESAANRIGYDYKDSIKDAKKWFSFYWHNNFKNVIDKIKEDAFANHIQVSIANTNKSDIQKMTFEAEEGKLNQFVNKYINHFVNRNGTIIFKDSIKDVNPREGESKADFLARFMNETKSEYPDEKQRYAVANSYWERKDRDSVKDSFYVVACEEGDYWFDNNGKPNSFSNAKKYNSYEEADRFRRSRGQGSVQKVSDSVKDASYDNIKVVNASSEIRQLCINNDWYTSGTNSDYSKLLRGADNGWTIRELAKDIYLHSSVMSNENVSSVESIAYVIYNYMKSRYSYLLKDSIKDSKYQFPVLTNEDIKYLSRYNLRLVSKLANGDCVVEGSKRDLARYGREYLDYQLHPDYLFDSVKDEDIEELSKEEQQAIEDYKKAISGTKDVKLLELYSHILREEIEHLRELNEARTEDSVKDEETIRYKEYYIYKFGNQYRAIRRDKSTFDFTGKTIEEVKAKIDNSIKGE